MWVDRLTFRAWRREWMRAYLAARIERHHAALRLDLHRLNRRNGCVQGPKYLPSDSVLLRLDPEHYDEGPRA